MKIAIIVVLVIVFINLSGLFFKLTKGNREIKKLNKEAFKNAKKAAEIIEKANKTKADARTGDHERDLDFMARKLHDYANK